MAQTDGANAFVVLGLILLVLGGAGLVYGQVSLQEHQDDRGFFDVGGGDEQDLQEYRLLRMGGLVVGVVGIVVTLTGAVND